MQWHTFAAASMNGETLRLTRAWRESQRLVQDQQNNDEEEEADEEKQAVIQDSQDSSAQPAAATQVLRDGVLKAQTALQLFRKDWLGAERTAGRRWSPCNVATWPACRAAFQALQPAVRATYEMQAAVTCVRAKSRREAGRTPLPQPRAVGHHDDEQPGDEQQAEPGGEKQAAPSIQAFAPMSNYGHAVEPDDVSGDAAGSDQPLTPDMLRSSFARLAARDVEARWRASSSSISNPGSGPDELPKQVVHPTCCGAICRNAATDRARALHAALLAAFTRSVATLSNQPARIASQDVILAVDVFVDAAEDAAPDRTKFCALATASGRFNRFPETQMFAFLDVVRGQAAPPYAGLLLQHRTRPVVTPCGVLPSPLDQARHGVLDACDQDAFAASLLYSDSGMLPTEWS